MSQRLVAIGLFIGIALTGSLVTTARAQGPLCDFDCRSAAGARTGQCEAQFGVRGACHVVARRRADRAADHATTLCNAALGLARARFFTKQQCRLAGLEAYGQVLEAEEAACDSKNRACQRASQAKLRTCRAACDPHAEEKANCERDGGEWDDAACVCNMQGSYQL